MMELEIDLQAERDEEIPRVFESAGGYSPTVGIIGAVLVGVFAFVERRAAERPDQVGQSRYTVTPIAPPTAVSMPRSNAMAVESGATGWRRNTITAVRPAVPQAKLPGKIE